MNWQKIKEINRINKALFVFVFLILIGWGILIISFAEKDIGTEKAANEMSQLVTNIRKHYQNRPDFWGLNSKTIIDKKIAPIEMIKNNELQSFYKTPVLVGNGEEALMLMPGAKSFDIIYKKLNKQQCIELASYRFDNKFWFGVMSVTLNNGSTSKTFNWMDANLLPIKKEDARIICKEDNMLIWHYE